MCVHWEDTSVLEIAPISEHLGIFYVILLADFWWHMEIAVQMLGTRQDFQKFEFKIKYMTQPQ